MQIAIGAFFFNVPPFGRKKVRLQDMLKRRGLDDDTVVVFASGHGDMLGHRGMLQKRYFYERPIRVALIFS